MPQGKPARSSRANGAGEDNRTISEKLNLGSEVKELKMGRSFMNDKSVSFHTMRYDFKPASVDVSKPASVAIEGNHKVTVTVPHVDGAGTPHTVYKGSYRPCQKECVLIIDRKTGKVTLEKLNSNIQLKKTRSESSFNKRSSVMRAQQMAKSLSTVIPHHSPLHPSPSHHSRSPTQIPNPMPTLASSLPLIGMEEIDSICTSVPIASTSQQENMGQQSSLPSLSSSSGSSSGSGHSDSEPENKSVVSHPTSFSSNNNNTNGQYQGFSNILNEDLQLSESGSDD